VYLEGKALTVVVVWFDVLETAYCGLRQDSGIMHSVKGLFSCIYQIQNLHVVCAHAKCSPVHLSDTLLVQTAHDLHFPELLICHIGSSASFNSTVQSSHTHHIRISDCLGTLYTTKSGFTLSPETNPSWSLTQFTSSENSTVFHFGDHPVCVWCNCVYLVV